MKRRFPGSVVIAYMHNMSMTGVPRLLAAKFFRRFDGVVFVSASLRDQFVERIGSRCQSKIPSIVVNNAVSTNLVAQGLASRGAAREYDVLFVGRVVPDKGVDVLISALSELADLKPRVLVVGGESFMSTSLSPFEKEVRRLAANHALDVTFSGPVRPEDVATYMNSASVVVVPSVWQDPCPLVVQEAKASSAAVVASEVGGIPEMGGATSGVVLVPPRRPGDLAIELRRLLLDRQYRDEIAGRGQSACTEWTWSDVNDRLTVFASQLRESAKKPSKVRERSR